jgi:hypothetical protein
VRRILIHTLIIILILLLGVSPLISAGIAGSIADANNCTLHEGFVNPCVIDGTDWGETLYTMGVLSWLAIGTFPIAIGLAGIYLLIVIIVAIIRSIRRRRAAANSMPPTK